MQCHRPTRLCSRRRPLRHPPRQLARAVVLACGLACAAALPALAAPPLATDDAQVLDARACEAALQVQRLRLRASPREDTIDTQLGCGLGHGLQATLAGGYSTHPDARNSERRDALALLVKGVLYAVPDGPALSLAGGSVMGRTGDAAFHFDSAYLQLAASAGLGHGVTGHANLGTVRSRSSGQHSTTWNLATEMELGRGWDAGLELYGDDRTRPWLGSALRWSVNDRLKLGAAYAVQANGLRQRLVQLGLTVAF